MIHADPVVKGMAALRLLSACTEMTAAFLMLHYGRVQVAMSINAALGLFGPILFALVSTLGFIGLAGEVSWSKMAIVFSGVLLVVYGATR